MTEQLDETVWMSRVRGELVNKSLLEWVVEVGGVALAGEQVPEETVDAAGYRKWVVDYIMVRTALETCLGNLHVVVMTDPRYKSLGEYCRMATRIMMIKEILSDYTQVRIFSVLTDWDIVLTDCRLMTCLTISSLLNPDPVA